MSQTPDCSTGAVRRDCDYLRAYKTSGGFTFWSCSYFSHPTTKCRPDCPHFKPFHPREGDDDKLFGYMVSYGRCASCGSFDVYFSGPRSRDVDNLDDWTDEEVEKLEQGWNPVQNFGDIMTCRSCGFSAQEDGYDVSY